MLKITKLECGRVEFKLRCLWHVYNVYVCTELKIILNNVFVPVTKFKKSKISSTFEASWILPWNATLSHHSDVTNNLFVLVISLFPFIFYWRFSPSSVYLLCSVLRRGKSTVSTFNATLYSIVWRYTNLPWRHCELGSKLLQ